MTLLLLVSAPSIAANDKTEVPGQSMTVPSAEVTAAFGIELGKTFRASMVTEVVRQQAKPYVAAGDEKNEGTLLQVVPLTPDDRFNEYYIHTTPENLIYAVRAKYQYDTEPELRKRTGEPKRSRKLRKTCQNEVKALADELESKFGKPRGAGRDGLWFNFRRIADSHDISVNLYANQCRTGTYSIVYTDRLTKYGRNP